mmetsp:Transcript_8109/g.19413  ORF Transcript_8109/g.19413 Transcript_8109/m.19413 type:complete len:244 (+) Transcript_8109:1219-1950(+)
MPAVRHAPDDVPELRAVDDVSFVVEVREESEHHVQCIVRQVTDVEKDSPGACSIPQDGVDQGHRSLLENLVDGYRDVHDVFLAHCLRRCAVGIRRRLCRRLAGRLLSAPLGFPSAEKTLDRTHCIGSARLAICCHLLRQRRRRWRIPGLLQLQGRELVALVRFPVLEALLRLAEPSRWPRADAAHRPALLDLVEEHRHRGSLPGALGKAWEHPAFPASLLDSGHPCVPERLHPACPCLYGGLE